MKIDRYWLYPSVALIAFVVGLTTANVAVNWVPRLGDAATWSGAVGAFLAFGATVFIATDQTRQKNLETHNRAVLTAAALVPKLRNFVQAADSMCWLMDELEVWRPRAQNESEVYPTYTSQINQACTWTSEEVMGLVSLPDDVAYRLQSALAMIPIIHLRMETEMAFTRLSLPPTVSSQKMRTTSMRYYIDSVKEIAGSLSVALTQCERILPPIPGTIRPSILRSSVENQL